MKLRLPRPTIYLLILFFPLISITASAAEQTSGSTMLFMGFETQPTGRITDFIAENGQWTSEIGNSSIVAGKQRTGKHSLRMKDDECILLWKPGRAVGDAYELSFWAERWTKNGSFEFRVEAYDGNAWQEVYRGDDEIMVGGYDTHIVIPLEGAVPKQLRFICRSDPLKGVLIDDVRISRRVNMSVQSAMSEPTGMPVLIGNTYNPVLRIAINSPGNIDKFALDNITLELVDDGDTSMISAIEVYGTDGRSALNWRDSDTVFDEAILIDTPQAPESSLQFKTNYPLSDGENYFWVSYTLIDNVEHTKVPTIRCRSVELSNGKSVSVTHLSNPARMAASQRIGIALRNTGDDGVAAYRIPGLATTMNGTLIAVYDARYHSWSDLPGDIDIGMSRSTDGGQTWEQMKIVSDMGDDPKWSYDGIGDPAVLVDMQTGTVWVAGLWSHGERGWKDSGPGLSPNQTGQLVLVKSVDDGATWSYPINITKQIKAHDWRLVFNGPGNGITMQDGTIVFAGQFKDADNMPFSTIIYSIDHGATWRIGSGAKPNTTEAQVAELANGSLMLNMRDNRGESRSVYITDDLGKTWTEHPSSRSALPDPVCQASLLAVDVPGLDNRVLLFSNPSVADKPRRNMTIKASLDGGLTWPEEHHLLIDAGQSAGYSCLTMIDNDTIGILFEGSRANITFLSIPLKEVMGDKMQ